MRRGYLNQDTDAYGGVLLRVYDDMARMTIVYDVVYLDNESYDTQSLWSFVWVWESS